MADFEFDVENYEFRIIDLIYLRKLKISVKELLPIFLTPRILKKKMKNKINMQCTRKISINGGVLLIVD